MAGQTRRKLLKGVAGAALLGSAGAVVASYSKPCFPNEELGQKTCGISDEESLDNALEEYFTGSAFNTYGETELDVSTERVEGEYHVEFDLDSSMRGEVCSKGSGKEVLMKKASMLYHPTKKMVEDRSIDGHDLDRSLDKSFFPDEDVSTSYKFNFRDDQGTFLSFEVPGRTNNINWQEIKENAYQECV